MHLRGLCFFHILRPWVIPCSDGEGGDAGLGVAAWCEDCLGRTPLAGFVEMPKEVRRLKSLQRNPFWSSNEFDDITKIKAIGPLLILHK